MTTASSRARRRVIEYPDSDGKPMAETPVHRNNMADQISTLSHRYAADANVYVSGNMMMYYVKGNPRKHVSPDVFVVFGIPKLPERDIYFVWKEGKGPDVAFEITSKSTRKEDTDFKMGLYRDVLKVKEYFLFDPYAEYLDPPLQGHRLRRGRYHDIQPVKGRLPSELLGLHLERVGRQLRLYDPATDAWLSTFNDNATRVEEVSKLADVFRQQAESQKQRADLLQQRVDLESQFRIRLETEIEHLRREVEDIRNRLGLRNGNNGQ